MRYEKYVKKPELAGRQPVLYPGVFPNLAAYSGARADLHAILLTGIPTGVVPGFQNYTGPVPSDMLRCSTSRSAERRGEQPRAGRRRRGRLPDGRRIGDDVVTIELRAVAGSPPSGGPVVHPGRGRGRGRRDGTTDTKTPLLDAFPYLGLPGGGYQTVPGTTQTS